MHDNANRWQASSSRWAEPQESGSLLTLRDVKTIFRRYGRLIAICVGVCLLLATLYTMAATRQYTAYARILIDTPRSPIVSSEASTGASGGLAVQEVESQIQVLQSDRIGRAVLAYMRQNNLDSSGQPPRKTFMQSIMGAVGGGIRAVKNLITGPPPEMDPERAALEELMDRMSVRRLGTSYVLEISYTSPDAELASTAANAFARAYMQDEVDSRAAVWRNASMWLEQRVHELRKRSEEAARAAQDFKAQNGSNADTWPKARELERTAEAYDALYSAFLRRHTDSVQQETFPISNSKIISEASRPLGASHPRTFLITIFATIFGLVIGLALALLRWSSDRTISSPSQITDFGVRCLATLPRLPKAVAADPRNAVRTALRSPRSHFTEALRMVHAEIGMAERQRKMRFIGVTSAMPGEGKTTISANLAQLFASSRPTLLIDGDARNPRLTDSLAPTIDPTYIVPSQTGPWLEPVPSILGCANLSFIGIDDHANSTYMPWHDQTSLEDILNVGAAQMDKVIIDLPPAGGVAEARYIAPLLDAIIVIVESERTPEEAMIACIDACNVEPGKVFGVVLNKAHESMLPASYGRSSSYFVPDVQATYVEPRKIRRKA